MDASCRAAPATAPARPRHPQPRDGPPRGARRGRGAGGLRVRAAHPHPAPAKLDDVSLSLRIPLPRAGEGKPSRGGDEDIESGREFAIDDTLAIRDRLHVIPGVREAAQDLGPPSARNPAFRLHRQVAPAHPPRQAWRKRHRPSSLSD
jgi:hypothetical protein